MQSTEWLQTAGSRCCWSLTCLGACEDAMVFGRHHLHSLLAVDRSIGQDHGRIVLIHEVPGDGADELAVHVLGPRQLLCQLLELLQQQVHT